jgi:hypothetical protein
LRISDIFLNIFLYFIKKTWAAWKDSAKKNLTQFQVLNFMLVTQSGSKGRDLKIWLSNFGAIKSKRIC